MNDDEFLAALEQCSLAESSFGHSAHVRAAYLYLRSGEFETALARMRGALRRYSAALGKPDRYHETITVAYLALIRQRLFECGDGGGKGLRSRTPSFSIATFCCASTRRRSWNLSFRERSSCCRTCRNDIRGESSSCWRARSSRRVAPCGDCDIVDGTRRARRMERSGYRRLRSPGDRVRRNSRGRTVRVRVDGGRRFRTAARNPARRGIRAHQAGRESMAPRGVRACRGGIAVSHAQGRSRRTSWGRRRLNLTAERIPSNMRRRPFLS